MVRQAGLSKHKQSCFCKEPTAGKLTFLNCELPFCPDSSTGVQTKQLKICPDSPDRTVLYNIMSIDHKYLDTFHPEDFWISGAATWKIFCR